MITFAKPNSQPVPSDSEYQRPVSSASLLTFFQPTNYSEITQRIATFYAVNPITYFPDRISESDGTPFLPAEKEALIEYVSMM